MNHKVKPTIKANSRMERQFRFKAQRQKSANAPMGIRRKAKVIMIMGWGHSMGSFDGIIRWDHSMGSFDGVIRWGHSMGS
ncbi:MAG TPA: hypothetical protein PKG95_14855, partial [Anaerolineaceae bacterium]|nr:hypothetical protein [Anaerolineaceae bacterium]